MDEAKLENRLTTLETQQQYMADQIIDMQETQSEIRSLAMSVNSLAGSVKRLVDDMCAANRRLDAIEAGPAQKWEKLKDTIVFGGIGVLVGAVISFLVSLILKGLR